MRYGKKFRICTDRNRVVYEHESAMYSDSKTSNVKQSAFRGELNETGTAYFPRPCFQEVGLSLNRTGARVIDVNRRGRDVNPRHARDVHAHSRAVDFRNTNDYGIEIDISKLDAR